MQLPSLTKWLSITSMGIYQKPQPLFKQAGSLNMRMSHFPLDIYSAHRRFIGSPRMFGYLDEQVKKHQDTIS